MKAEGLMVGDLLTFKDCVGDSGFPILKVNGILPDSLFVRIDYSDADDEVDYEDIIGIPLTPEILENNGFTYVGKKVWQWEEKPFWVWWEEENHHLGIEIDDSSYDEEKTKTIMIIVQNYVHELQHALRLCGIEKEIVI